ncbi:MAG: RnfABCDGE type electron transport complex subunit D [Eubacterium sp.]|nr:RnfABCDGE type electron transport complex subunit D [Eubacterium sp.]
MYNVSVSPHVRDKSSSQKIMLDVAIALLPTLGYGVYHFWSDFGARPLMLILVSVASCVAFEALFELITKRPITVFDFSAVVTGLIIALNLPPTATWWMPVLGSAFGIIAAKMLFGGLGQNFMNPALAGRCFLVISFTQRMTNFAVDATSSATPLAVMKNADTLPKMDLLNLFIGNHGGCIGEVSALCILIGAAYLLVKKIISPVIPCVYILSTVAIIAIIRFISKDEVTVNYLVAQALSGGLLAGAFFMATDYVTSPITFKGKIIFALVLGLLTALFRTLGSTAEGVSYAIIIGNLLVPIIEKKTISLPFGCERVKKVKAAKEESK